MSIGMKTFAIKLLKMDFWQMSSGERSLVLAYCIRKLVALCSVEVVSHIRCGLLSCRSEDPRSHRTNEGDGIQ